MEVFNNLEFAAKCEILNKYAHYVETIAYFHYTITLFSWDRYFVEVYYDSEEENISRISVATDADLDKYTRDIQLADLEI